MVGFDVIFNNPQSSGAWVAPQLVEWSLPTPEIRGSNTVILYYQYQLY